MIPNQIRIHPINCLTVPRIGRRRTLITGVRRIAIAAEIIHLAKLRQGAAVRRMIRNITAVNLLTSAALINTSLPFIILLSLGSLNEGRSLAYLAFHPILKLLASTKVNTRIRSSLINLAPEFSIRRGFSGTGLEIVLMLRCVPSGYPQQF